MKPVLFHVESISLGHIARMVVVARMLRDAGQHVVFACGDNHRAVIEAERFDVTPVPVIDPTVAYGRLTKLMPTYRYEELEGYYKADLPLVQKIDPGLIVFDMRLTIPLIGERLSIPTASIANGIYSRYFKLPMTAPHFIVNRSHLPQTTMDRFFASGFGQWVGDRFERPFSKPIDRLYETHGGTPQGRFAYYLSAGDVSLLADIPDIVPLENAPASVAHIGSSPWTPPALLQRDSDPVAFNTDQPRVYFATGSSVFPDALVRPAVDDLLARGFEVLLQTKSPEGFVPTDRLHVRSFVPNAQVLPHVDVVISHGGVTTTYEAMLAGTPVIGVPSFTDQQWNMDRFVASGCAAMLNPGKLTASRLGAQVQAVIDDKRYSTRAAEIGERVSAFAAADAVLGALSPYLDGATVTGPAATMRQAV